MKRIALLLVSAVTLCVTAFGTNVNTTISWPQIGETLDQKMNRLIAIGYGIFTNPVTATITGDVNTATNVAVGTVEAVGDGIGTNALLVTSSPGGANNSGPLASLLLGFNPETETLWRVRVHSNGLLQVVVVDTNGLPTTLGGSGGGTNVVPFNSSGTELFTAGNPGIVKPNKGTNVVVARDVVATNLFSLQVATTANSLLQATNGNFAGIITNTLAAVAGGHIELRSIQVMTGTNCGLTAWVFGTDPGTTFTNGQPISLTAINAAAMQRLVGPLALSTVGSLGRPSIAGTGNNYVSRWSGSEALQLATTNVYILFQFSSSGQTNFPGASADDWQGTNVVTRVTAYDDSL